MSKTAVITARLNEQMLGDLDRLAEHLERSRAWIVQKAVERYVQEECAFLAFAQIGIDAADRGELISQEEMERWFDNRRQLPAAAG